MLYLEARCVLREGNEWAQDRLKPDFDFLKVAAAVGDFQAELR